MDLSITEKFILLAQHPAKAKFMVSDIHVNYGFSGSLLLEMSEKAKISIDNDLVVLQRGERSSNPVISEIESLINDSGKSRKMKYWVSKIAGKSGKYKKIFLQSLANKRLIRIESKRFLGLIPYMNHYLLDSRTRNSLIQELKNSVLQKKALKNDITILLSLVEACKMHKVLATDKIELKKLKKELKEIVKNNPIAGTVDQTIQEVQVAVMAAIFASTIASTTAVTSS
ncbi:GPP34 family phosphoprotein [Fulvivirga sp. M361]|uniref:GOLPH3/VPS74 family protein n=1 Tax=Fulvivirga sp. M361 TaxID=2594266 RepID=UPI00117B3A4B|nr:GPP34 family phosphoprotein [Fulvivirga sp. M361]TRX52418.1 GPP34 family phosphoprotein [Fulvivirga sp. M361]